jgi:zinc transport system substrate-binding protein
MWQKACKEKFLRIQSVVLILSLMIAIGIFCAGCQDNEKSDETVFQNSKAKVRLVATIYPLAEFAKGVGGDRVEVIQLIPQGREPHHWEPSPADMLRLYQAQVFVYNGAGMEPWADKILPALRAKKISVVKGTEDLNLLTFAEEEKKGITVFLGQARGGAQAEDADHQQHDGDVDPHVWLDPVLVKSIVSHLTRELIAVDPAGSSDYLRNAQALQGKLDQLNQEYLEASSEFKSRDLVVSHAAFGYLAQRYDLRQIPVLGLTPEQEPDAATLARVTDYVRKNGVKYIFFEAMVSPRVAETVARETGAQTLVLNPIGGITEEELQQGLDYFGLMRQNLENLKKALGN